jgi:NAD(P)H-dependent flavin oxidoreductase YrpB (nitropropane dioxygenase family)
MLKSVQIRHKKLSVPIIQGGMGVGVSLGNLAGSVMKEGGMGVVSAAHPGYNLETFEQDSVQANCFALYLHARKARNLAQGKGLLGVNIMCASKDYDTYVKESIRAGYDAIISGAGLPLKLPALTKGSNILLAPVVSSGKAAELICKVWLKRYDRLPDFVVLEGPKAGGHLGFAKENLQNNTCPALTDLVKEVREVLDSYESQKDVHIPLFAAGGIFDGKDIAEIMQAGADGVQMGTRFIATKECDAHPVFKQAFVSAKEDDLFLVKSPAGFPGRAIKSPMMNKVMDGEDQKISKCLACLSPCKPGSAPYCISRALIDAVKGDWDNGLFFSGSNGYKVASITSVHELMESLQNESVEGEQA